MRTDFERILPIGQVEIGMMTLRLHDSPNLIRKRQSLREILEGVAPLQMPSPVECPALAEFLL